MKHLESLDGIRAIAIAMVMCYHFGYFAPGWIGVQLFFTLSGYLITGILLRNKNRPLGVYLGTFFWHRALRILPLLWFFLIIAAIVYVATGVPTTFRSDWPWLLGFLGNFARLRSTDLAPPLVHIWSLAVEQQFYLVWPLAVYFLPTTLFRRFIVCLLLFTPLVRLAVFQATVLLGHDAEVAGKVVYVLPFTQLDAFATGAAIAVFSLEQLPNSGRRFLAALIATGALGAAVLAAENYSGQGAFVGSLGYAMYLLQSHGYVWGYSMLNLLAMLAMICALRRAAWLRFLESATLTWVGRISFGMYVYHLPLLLAGEAAMAKLVPHPDALMRAAFFAIWMCAVLLVSTLSYRWIEAPFLAMKNRGWIAEALRNVPGSSEPSR
ncbi:MAG TPA: acyltransferase [Steroidobacteraceae bacterium]|nr:acyltransferase [Steroidobacteraceae bacterium]